MCDLYSFFVLRFSMCDECFHVECTDLRRQQSIPRHVRIGSAGCSSTTACGVGCGFSSGILAMSSPQIRKAPEFYSSAFAMIAFRFSFFAFRFERQFVVAVTAPMPL
jgi:hypothetical protein